MNRFLREHVDAVRAEVVRPVLEAIDVKPGLKSERAECLVSGTGLEESKFHYIRQHGGGPGASWFQHELWAAEDLWDRYLRRGGNRALREAIKQFMTPQPFAAQLATNQMLACALCRVRYWMVADPLPARTDSAAMGRYWKAHYNTASGAGTAEKFAKLYEEYVL